MVIRSIQAICLGCLLTGCSTTAAVGALTSLVSPASKGVSAELQLGDKATQVQTTGKQESNSTMASVEKVRGSVDQSNKKQDRKTEIGQVKGDVKVTQGPSLGTIIFLGAGWPLFLGFLIYLVYRNKP